MKAAQVSVGRLETKGMDLRTELRQRFGLDDFLPGQRQVIEALLAGRSAAAVFPTGGGKSLCYQLPALLLPGTTVVVSPLIALMKDQIDSLASRGISAVRLDSTLDSDAYRQATEQIRSGAARLLYVSPERFGNERFRSFLEHLRIALFAVDEAHCISEWGHNFRPDYLKLARFADACRAQCRLALTATATTEVLADICREFAIDAECAVRTPFYRSNLVIRGTAVTQNSRAELLAQRLVEHPRGATIVYVTQQRTAEEVASQLASQGFPARAYHAGLQAAVREETQNWFLAEPDPIIVATIAFGMGIDKPDIRYVYHYNLSKSLENYAQEIGRAGRDGQEAICETLVCADDLRVLENFVYGDTPTSAAVHAMLAEIFSQGREFSVSEYQLAATHDIRQLVVRTLLTYLQLEGYLAAGTPFYAEYRIQPQETSARILARFDGERRQFLSDLFRCARKAKSWFMLDIEAAVRQTRSDRGRVVRALEYLSAEGLLKLQTSGVRMAYRRLRAPDDLHALGDQLHKRLVDRQQRDLDRLRQMLELFTQPECSMLRLTRHFDHSLSESCGNCSVCQAGQGVAVSGAATRAINDDTWTVVRDLRRRFRDVFTDDVVVARFLCGITTPWLTRAKLTSHRLAGSLEDMPLHDVVQQVQAHAAK